MSENRCIPLAFDFIELRLRMPVRRPDDRSHGGRACRAGQDVPEAARFIREAGVQLPISRVL